MVSTLQTLISANHLQSNPASLSIGQSLTIPLVDAVAAVTPEAPGQSIEYQVQNGDTLYEIAAKNGIDVQTLISANDLESHPASLSIGQSLTIPLAPAATATVEPPSATVTVEAPVVAATAEPPAATAIAEPPVVVAVTPVARDARPATYEVQNGDTLYDIAAKNGIDVQTLIAANNLGSHPANLSIGQSLTIPLAPGAAAVTAAASAVARAPPPPRLPLPQSSLSHAPRTSSTRSRVVTHSMRLPPGTVSASRR